MAKDYRVKIMVVKETIVEGKRLKPSRKHILVRPETAHLLCGIGKAEYVVEAPKGDDEGKKADNREKDIKTAKR